MVDQPYSYTGQRLDSESSLQYYRARYFDNDLGRFINRDPIGYVDGLNLYQGYFVNGGLDPFGFSETTIVPSKESGWTLNRKTEQWSIEADKFKEKYMSDAEKKVGESKFENISEDHQDKNIFDTGCVGVTHCMLQKK